MSSLMSVFLLSIFSLLTISSAFHLNGSFVSDERILYNALLAEYQRNIRPVQTSRSENVTVKFRLTLLRVNDLDTERQILQTSNWVMMLWQDFQLKWDPLEYGGVDELRVPITELWSPDIEVYNSIDPEISFPTRHLAVVSYTGDVLWIPPVSLNTYCSINLRSFPYDTQVCSIKFGSWTFSADLVDFQLDGDEVHLYNYIQSNQWTLVEVKSVRNQIYYACCKEPYVDITFNLVLKRKSTLSTHLFMAPSVALSLIIPAVFVMPAGSREKINLGIGVLVAHVLLLGEMIKFVPVGHGVTVPLMAQYFVANIVLVSLSVVISTVLVNFWSRGVKRSTGPPAALKMIFLNQVLTKLLCFDFSENIYVIATGIDNPLSVTHDNLAGSIEVCSDLTTSADDRIRKMQNNERHLAASDWRRLADVIDRLFLFLYILAVVILSLIYMFID